MQEIFEEEDEDRIKNSVQGNPGPEISIGKFHANIRNLDSETGLGTSFCVLIQRAHEVSLGIFNC